MEIPQRQHKNQMNHLQDNLKQWVNMLLYHIIYWLVIQAFHQLKLSENVSEISPVKKFFKSKCFNNERGREICNVTIYIYSEFHTFMQSPDRIS